MATQAYYDWVAAGRPWRLARPVLEYRAAFRASGWPSEALGTIGDEAHLQAGTPRDHTPFSVTGWPVAHPYPYVTAIDVGHNPSAGRDLTPVVARWIEEARAGRTPWVKYVVYRGQRWDVRDDWQPVAATGHYDHAHVSMRTDHVSTAIGAWAVAGGGNPVGTTQTGRDVWAEGIHSPALELTASAAEYLKYAVSASRAAERTETQVAVLQAAVETLLARPGSEVDPAELGAALAASEPFVDAIATAVAARLGMIPTAIEIARAVGELDWHGSVR